MKEKFKKISEQMYKIDETSYFITDTKKLTFYLNSGKIVKERDIDVIHRTDVETIIREILSN
jgi:hypothetical protein